MDLYPISLFSSSFLIKNNYKYNSSVVSIYYWPYRSSVRITSKIYSTVKEELDFLGDILSAGIINKSLTKVGTSPDKVKIDEMKKALDVHIAPALVSFVGPNESRRISMKIKTRLDKLNTVAS
jgi:hypothetical protein